jgi:hypothetical protein
LSIVATLASSDSERPLSDHRRRVRVALTSVRRQAFEGHVVDLEAVIAGAEPSTAWRHRSRVPAFIVRHGRVPV